MQVRRICTALKGLKRCREGDGGGVKAMEDSIRKKLLPAEDE